MDLTAEVLTSVRRVKSEAKASMRTPVARLIISGSVEQRDLLQHAEPDLGAAAVALEVVYEDGAFAVETVLA
jgi:3-hydroxy-3-methylglutaryl CoA synthase